MREIKFRAWDGRKMTKEFHIDSNGKVVARIAPFTDIKPLILMQYTGLKDKNGKEIYEEDILSLHQYYYLVGWYKYGWFLRAIDNFNDLKPISAYKNLKIIGNIYENPELLKEK